MPTKYLQAWTVMLGLSFGFLAYAAAPSAHADTISYLEKLRNAGIQTPRGDLELKEWGWEVCALFDRGADPVSVVEQAVYNSGSKPQHGLSVDQANMIVDTAVSDLCAQPNHR